ncbi:lysine-specific demethylase JMJ32 [Primulina huaijiensis]|uniref:lysine-specific demethylase JMJ32 n=1 Tax=Primulina huaijiensis TaxID=1492673 RepID=UPI003CC71F70
MEDEEVEAAIQSLWQEVRDLSLGKPPHIDHLPTPPTPLQFLRHYVTSNKPCLISDAVTHWPAITSWTSTSYLLDALSSSSPVSLHLTPTGHADSLAPHPITPSSLCFASAHVQNLPFQEALEMVLRSGEDNRVAYLQQQNDCFRSEYAALAGDCEEDIWWASEALGCKPDAVNLWIGNQFSETSFHKDHYENLYVVISGEKRFLLLPPTDIHRMYITEYPAAHYCYNQDRGEFTLELEDPVRYVPWCSLNPYPSPCEKQREINKFPLYFNGPKPFEVTVKAGEMLYLPSMWFHHVRQSSDERGLTIAINYWYDMGFDIKYAYFNFLQSIPYSRSKDPIFCQNGNVKYDDFGSVNDSGYSSDVTAASMEKNQDDRDENQYLRS